MIKKVFDLFVKVEKPLLGRWNLKSCNEISTSINSIYQNRDHCGDNPRRRRTFLKRICDIQVLKRNFD